MPKNFAQQEIKNVITAIYIHWSGDDNGDLGSIEQNFFCLHSQGCDIFIHVSGVF